MKFPCSAFLFFSLFSIAAADVKVPTIFGDHMVLQQGTVLPVWGLADPGERVTVTVADKSLSTTAGEDGKWKVSLPALSGLTPPLSMTIAGKNTLTFQDVVLGEVWVASGQSNMGISLKSADTADKDIPNATDTLIRYFHVSGGPDLWPSSKLECGKWELCTPEIAAAKSAVAYYFAKELRSNLNAPVGVILSAWGGTAIEPWTPLAAIQDDPYFEGDRTRHAQMVAEYPKLQEEFPAKQQEWREAQVEWNKNGGPAYTEALKVWNQAAAKAKAAGQPEPPDKPVAPSVPEPKQPSAPNGGVGSFGALYHGVIAPVVPYAIKGVIWYQGESNAGNAARYGHTFPALIKGWRQQWGQGDFPFLFVQLPGWIQGVGWPAMREVQSSAQALPNALMVSIIDIGNRNDIHPAHKSTVGQRLSLAARHLAYGQDLTWSGPVYESMTVEGSSIRLKFKNTDGGLLIGQSPWTPAGFTPLPTDKLLGFAISDEKKQWIAADARIDGDTVVVSSEKITAPVAVRYAWRFWPECNLYNKANLPAPPFRTDDWSDLGESPPRPAQ